jgi:hypothetical protein
MATISFTATFGPGWDTVIADLLQDPIFESAVDAGHERFVELVDEEVEDWSAANHPVFTSPNASRIGSTITSEAETDSVPFVWVDEGVPNYGFGGPGSGYHMTFPRFYSPKSDGGGGERYGPIVAGVDVINSRGIRARGILDQVIAQHGDDVLNAIAAVLG